MRYNYEAGENETLSLQNIGTASSTARVISIENGFTNIYADLLLYTNAGGTAQVPLSSYDYIGEDETLTALEVGQTGKTLYRAFQVTDPTYQGITLYATFLNYGTYTDNQAVVDYMTASRDIYNPRRFTSTRIDSEELTSVAIPTLDWITIAETDAVNLSVSATLRVVWTGVGKAGSLDIDVAYIASSGNKTAQNTPISYKNNGKFSSGDGGVDAVRILKSDTSATAGAKIQIRNTTSITPVVHLLSNVASGTRTGFKIVTPTQTDNDKCPDGSVGTAIEAGAELSFAGETVNVLRAKKISNDILAVSVMWNQIPKQATNVTLNFPSGNINITDGAGNTITLSTGTFSNLTITGEIVNFRITNIAAFGTLNNGPIADRWDGTSGNITLS